VTPGGNTNPIPSQIPGTGSDGSGPGSAYTPGIGNDEASGGGNGAGGPTGGSFGTGGISSTGLTGGQAYSEGGRAFDSSSPFSGYSGHGLGALGSGLNTAATMFGGAAPTPGGVTAPLTLSQIAENMLNLFSSFGANVSNNQASVAPSEASLGELGMNTQGMSFGNGINNNGMGIGASNTGTSGVSSTGVGYGGLGQSPGVSGVDAQGNLTNGMFGQGGIFGGPSAADTGLEIENDTGQLGQSAGGPNAPGPGATAQGGVTGTTGVGQANDAATSAAAAGGGGGSAGDKVICTALHDMGLMPDYIYEKDREFARTLDPIVYSGYRCWALPVANILKANPILAVACKPIVMAWAREMAGEHNLIGSLIMKAGMRLCRYIGVKRGLVRQLR
jgi:hypothetical protein